MSTVDKPWDSGMKTESYRLNWAFGPATKVNRTSVTNSVASATFQAAQFDAETFDFGDMFTLSNPTRLTIPVAGLYAFGSSGRWSSNTNGFRFLGIEKNGNEVLCGTYAPTADVRDQEVTGFHTFNVNDYIEALLFQTSGTTLTWGTGILNMKANLWAAMLRPLSL